jgi:ubiquinone/menaquinone biosynthesis C-methylase UbiE
LNVRKGSHILDVGCGLGDFIRFAAKYNCTGVGIDFSENMVNRAREIARVSPNGEKCTFMHGDAYDVLTSFKENSFDAVFSIAAMHHMDYSKIIPLVKDVIKTGGDFTVIDIYRSSSASDYILNGLAAAGNPLANFMRNFGKQPKSEEEKQAWKDHAVLDNYKTIDEIKAELNGLGVKYTIQRLLYFRYLLTVKM